MKRKVVKLTQGQLRKLVEGTVREAWGPYDASGVPGQETSEPMYPQNFESMYKELFNQALDPVVEEFVRALMDIHEAGFAPEGREFARKEAKEVAEAMREDLMKKLEEWLEEGIDRIV